jgi:hypothetical protein
MSKLYSREETLRIAKEKVRLQKEKEKREEKEFYEKVTSGNHWLFFKLIVGFCTLMVVLTTIEVFVDGESKKLNKDECRIDRQLYMMWHQSIKVDDYLFLPHFRDWSDHVDSSFEITYSPIFRTGKKLSYDIQVSETAVRRHEEIRRRSIFTWFPYLQIFMLVPLITFIFKRQKPMFNFARVGSMALVFPGTILVIILTLL